MKRSPPPKRRTPMPRSGRVRPRNPERAEALDKRNFGGEAERVRLMPCLCRAAHSMQAIAIADVAYGRRPCIGETVAAHADPRGMGGCNSSRFRLFNACAFHHEESGEAGTSKRADFERRYGVDVSEVADRIALEHPRPLGIRGLADRWALSVTLATVVCGDRLDGYETDALLGWVRREMARESARRVRRVREDVDVWKAADREALSYHIEQTLGGCFASDPGRPIGLAWSLCESAGWPS